MTLVFLAAAFFATVVIEGVIARAFLGRGAWGDNFLVQLTTWPAAILLYWSVVEELGHPAAVVAMELPVVVVEVFLWRALRGVTWGRASALSLAANLGSALIGGTILGLG